MLKSRRRQPPKQFDLHRSLPTTPIQRPGLPAPPLEESTKRWTWRRILLLVTAIFLAAFIAITTWDVINLSRASQKLFGSGNLFTLLSTQAPKGSAEGRVNILLVGYSVDDQGHPGDSLTDSIMVLSLSTDGHKSYMLSVPRDLFVNIPGFGYGKINEAYKDGGMKLLEDTISQDLKVNLGYYMLINYSAVRNLVNAVGGINVDIKSPDPRGLYDPNINKADGGPLKLTNGWHHLDGQTALNLTRARGDDYRSYGFPQSDFDRTMHQRQVLNAIKQKLGWWLVLNPLENGKVAQALAKNIKTNIPANQARHLFSLYHSVPDSQLASISLNNFGGLSYLASYNADGESALIPAAGINNYSQIDSLIINLNKSAPSK